MTYPCFADIARSFAPGWFTAVIGAGVWWPVMASGAIFQPHP